MNHYIDLSPDIALAMEQGWPVVALESSMISHGFSWPHNLETARGIAQAVINVRLATRIACSLNEQ